MSVTAILALITAIAKMFPVIDHWIILYAEQQLIAAKADQASKWAEARRRWALNDTSGVEDAIGSENAGKPGTDHEGIETRPVGGFHKNLALAFLVLFLGSCVSRERVQADIFRHDQMPVEVCGPKPVLISDSCKDNPQGPWCFGVYRTILCKYLPDHPRCLNAPPDAQFEEYRPYCDPSIKNYSAISDVDLQRYLEKFTTPEGNKGKGSK